MTDQAERDPDSRLAEAIAEAWYARSIGPRRVNANTVKFMAVIAVEVVKAHQDELLSAIAVHREEVQRANDRWPDAGHGKPQVTTADLNLWRTAGVEDGPVWPNTLMRERDQARAEIGVLRQHRAEQESVIEQQADWIDQARADAEQVKTEWGEENMRRLKAEADAEQLRVENERLRKELNRARDEPTQCCNHAQFLRQERDKALGVAEKRGLRIRELAGVAERRLANVKRFRVAIQDVLDCKECDLAHENGLRDALAATDREEYR